LTAPLPGYGRKGSGEVNSTGSVRSTTLRAFGTDETAGIIERAS
jgi:uncharacterized protein with GYD domain